MLLHIIMVTLSFSLFNRMEDPIKLWITIAILLFEALLCCSDSTLERTSVLMVTTLTNPQPFHKGNIITYIFGCQYLLELKLVCELCKQYDQYNINYLERKHNTDWTTKKQQLRIVFSITYFKLCVSLKWNPTNLNRIIRFQFDINCNLCHQDFAIAWANKIQTKCASICLVLNVYLSDMTILI